MKFHKVGIVLPIMSCMSHEHEIVCSERHRILLMPLAHTKNNNLLLPLVLLKLENDTWRCWRFWAPNCHTGLDQMQADFQFGGFFQGLRSFFITLWKNIFLVNEYEVWVLVTLVYYCSCHEFTEVVIGLEPIAQKIPHLILCLTKEMNSLTLRVPLLGFS